MFRSTQEADDPSGQNTHLVKSSDISASSEPTTANKEDNLGKNLFTDVSEMLEMFTARRENISPSATNF
jgi:hypothetical protein